MVTAISGSTTITFLHEKTNPKNWHGPLVMQGFSNCSGLFQVIMVNVGEYTSYMDSMGFRSCKQIPVEGGNKTSPPPKKKNLQFCRLFLVILWIEESSAQKKTGTYPRYPKIHIMLKWKDLLRKQVVDSLGYVPEVCWSFLRLEGHLSNLVTQR